MKSLKIFLGDLTYDTITLATEASPLNIGFVASYCLSKYPNNVVMSTIFNINRIPSSNTVFNIHRIHIIITEFNIKLV